MSIKINKALGYGTDQLVVEGGELKDSRFDARGFSQSSQTGLSEKVVDTNARNINLAFTREFQDDAKAERLFEYMKEEVHTLDRKLRNRGGRSTSTSMGMYHEFESSDIPAVVFVPPNVTGWYRRDDVIDYHEHGMSPGGSFRYLDTSCIFPLTGEMRRFRGQSHFEWEPKNIGGGHYNHLTGHFSVRGQTPLLKGDDLQDMLENWRPTLPWMLLAWIQIQDWITDKKGFANMLRPCIYVYWS